MPVPLNPTSASLWPVTAFLPLLLMCLQCVQSVWMAAECVSARLAPPPLFLLLLLLCLTVECSERGLGGCCFGLGRRSCRVGEEVMCVGVYITGWGGTSPDWCSVLASHGGCAKPHPPPPSSYRMLKPGDAAWGISGAAILVKGSGAYLYYSRRVFA